MSRSKTATVEKAAPGWGWEVAPGPVPRRYRCRYEVDGVAMTLEAEPSWRTGPWTVTATEIASDDTDPGKPARCAGDIGINLPAVLLRAAHALAKKCKGET